MTVIQDKYKQAKLPVQNLDLEGAILGALLVDSEAIFEVSEILKPEDFYSPANQEVYKAVLILAQEDNPIDMITVTQKLREASKLEQVGGVTYIAGLTSQVNSSANIASHCRKIKEMSIKRKLSVYSVNLQAKTYSHASDCFDLLQDLQNTAIGITESLAGASEKSIIDLADELEKGIDTPDLSQLGCYTGLKELDKILNGGFYKSDLIVLGARPSMGKTSLALCMLLSVAIDQKKPVGLFSMETSKEKIIQRLAGIRARVDMNKYRTGCLEENEKQRLRHAISEIKQAPIFIDDSVNTGSQVVMKSKRWKLKHNVELIMLDYLQMFPEIKNQNGKGGRTDLVVGSLVKGCKNIAKTCKIPFVLLSQLNRDVKNNENFVPSLNNLKESGAIEEAADFVGLLHRPSAYAKECVTFDYKNVIYSPDLKEQNMLDFYNSFTNLFVEKNRDGIKGNIKMKFTGKYTRFDDFEEPGKSPSVKTPF